MRKLSHRDMRQYLARGHTVMSEPGFRLRLSGSGPCSSAFRHSNGAVVMPARVCHFRIFMMRGQQKPRYRGRSNLFNVGFVTPKITNSRSVKNGHLWWVRSGEAGDITRIKCIFTFIHTQLYCLIFFNHNHQFYVLKFMLHKSYKFQWTFNLKSIWNRKKFMKTQFTTLLWPKIGGNLYKCAWLTQPNAPLGNLM